MDNYNPRNNNHNNKNHSNNNYNNNRNFNNKNNCGERNFSNGNGNGNGNGNFRNNYNNGNYRSNGNNNNYNKGGNFNNTNNHNSFGESRIRTYPTELNLATNYFRFSHLNSSRNCFYLYSFEIIDFPADSKKMRKLIYVSSRPQISKVLGKTIFNNTMLVSKTLLQNQEELFFTTKFNDVEYKIEIKFTRKIENDSFEALAIYKRFFNNLISHIDYIDMRRSFFDAKNACVMSDYNLDIWSGFAPTVSQLKIGILLNLNVTHKVIRYETALDLILSLKNSYHNKNDFVREVQSQMQNMSVITRYNGETNFIIDSICLDKSPRDTFQIRIRKGSGPLQKMTKKRLPASENFLNDTNINEQKNHQAKSVSGSKEIQEFEIRTYSYVEYYSQKYGKNVNPDQPLLKVINKKKENQEIFLIPELCYLGGLTESMRSNFNMMKDLNARTKGNPTEKLIETQGLISKILNTPGGKRAIEDWEITLEPEVMRLKGTRIDTGNVLMAQQKDNSGTRIKIDIDATPDLDRKIQNEMYSQPQLNNWVVKIDLKKFNSFFFLFFLKAR